MHPKLVTLGNQVDVDGFWPVEAKVEAILRAPPPSNTSELEVLLGNDPFLYPVLTQHV